jgi:hypothetical protein
MASAAGAAVWRDWSEFYIQSAKEICSTMFKPNDLQDKHWQNFDVLAESEAKVFWSVAIHHPQFPKVLQKCVEEAERSTHAMKDRITVSQYRSVVAVVSRLVLAFDPSGAKPEVRRCSPSPNSVASRLAVLLPPHILPQLSLVLFKSSPIRASTVLTALLVQSPSLLRGFHSYVQRWCDTVEDCCSSALQEAKRGRFQRRPADILTLVERSYRGVKQVWAILHSCPALVEYCSLDRLLNSFKGVVDTLSPLLQYFIMTCEQLGPRRPQLAKALAATVNSAVDAAIVAVVATKFSGGPDPKKANDYILPELYRTIERTMVEHVTSHCTGPTRHLLNQIGSISGLLNALVPPGEHNNAGKPFKIGPVLIATITASPKFSIGQFGVHLMTGLARHGLLLTTLVKDRFLLSDEATKLGATEDVSLTRAALAESSVTQSQTQLRRPSPPPQQQHRDPVPQPTKSEPLTVDDHAIATVQEVLPHLHPESIAQALRYYKNDVETLICEALAGNLPPHLQDMVGHDEGASATQGKAPPAATAAPTAQLDAGEAEPSPLLPEVDFGTDMHAFLSSDLQQDDLTETLAAIGSSYYDDGSGKDRGKLSTLRNDDGDEFVPLPSTVSSDDLFAIDDDMKERIRQLSEMMYEDEYDDTEQDPANAVQYRAAAMESDSSDDEPSGGRSSAPPMATTPPPDSPSSTSTGFNNPNRTARGQAQAAAPHPSAGKKPAYASKPKSHGDKSKALNQRRQADRDKRRGPTG